MHVLDFSWERYAEIAPRPSFNWLLNIFLLSPGTPYKIWCLEFRIIFIVMLLQSTKWFYELSAKIPKHFQIDKVI